MFTIKVAETPEDRQKVYDIRYEVFVIESSVPAEYERDELDESGSTHFLGYVDNIPMAVSRIVVRGSEVQIGRVCVLPVYRGKGYGKRLMQEVIDYIQGMDGIDMLFLHAMETVIKFYEDLGFKIEGDRFMEAGIAHFAMRRRIENLSNE